MLPKISVTWFMPILLIVCGSRWFLHKGAAEPLAHSASFYL